MTWYNTSWRYRRIIIIDHTKVSGDLNDFPVLISVSDLSNILPNGADIRFTTDNGITELPREIESYAGGILVTWVKTNLSSTVDTIIYMYYGNVATTEPAANSTYGSQAVWSNGYAGVWHLGNGTILSAADSTGVNNGTLSGSTLPSVIGGNIDGAADFNGVVGGSYIDAGINSSLNLPANLSFSAWIYPHSLTGPHFLIERRTGDGLDAVYSVYTSSNKLELFRYDGTSRIATSTSTLNLNTWNYVAIVVDTTSHKVWLYVNSGTPNEVSLNGGGNTSPTGSTYIGRSTSSTTREFNGLIDNLNISTVARTANWIATEYANQNVPGTFLTLGTEVLMPFCAPSNSMIFGSPFGRIFL